MLGAGLDLSPQAIRAARGILAGTAPSLDLSFLYGAMDGRVSFARASAASYFDGAGVLRSAAANQPRFDYDPATLAARGLLIEEARTNLWLNSSAVNAWVTLADATITPDATLAPDGTLSADLVTMGANAAAPGQSVTMAAATAYGVSLYIKEGATAPWLRCRIATAASALNAYFNLSTFTAGTLGSGISGTRAENIGGGWWRLSFQYLPSAGDEGARGFSFSGVTANGSGTAQGSFTVWGVQVEAGAFPTSYIPTAGASATRAADVATMPLGAWFNAAAGTLAADFSVLSTVTSARIVSVNDGTLAERLELIVSGTGLQWLVVDDSVTQAGPNITPAVVAGQVEKFAGVYALNDFQAARSGSLGVQDTAGTVPTVTTLRLGGQIAASAPLNGHIRRVRYYPSRLTNAQLQELTAA